MVCSDTALQRKILKEMCNRYLWNYRDKRYAYGYPIDTNSSYCSCETAAGGTGKVGDVMYTFNQYREHYPRM
jgi:hypothetical protein